MNYMESINKYPFEDWYKNTVRASSVQECDICQSILAKGIQADVAHSWANYNVYYEALHAPDAVAHAAGGGNIFQWAKRHWMFHYSDLLPRIEWEGLIKKTGQTTRFVHIGCGALPFTGIFFSRYFDKVCLVDFDRDACDWARRLIQALNIDNIEIYNLNGKDFAMRDDDTLMIASMVLDKGDIIKAASENAVPHLLLRSTDQRARGIFYNKDHDISASLNYAYQARTYPPAQIGNVTYHYMFR